MSFDDIVAGAAVFLDANTFVYHFSKHPKLGTRGPHFIDPPAPVASRQSPLPV
jgi:hypothetical protein